ncbi:MAG: c-di-GMP-binding flagellar brake protein YcgR [Alteromonadaceae bacterium]|jgi:c-di-GMP-binding flagellar brake protein YcgR
MKNINDDELERRQSFRLDMEKELVDIVWTDLAGQTYQKKISCLDFSRGGLLLACDQAIEISAEVTIIFKAANPNSQRLYGKVLRCYKLDNGWFEVALRLND